MAGKKSRQKTAGKKMDLGWSLKKYPKKDSV
jgi:hypothetical protein